MQYVKKYLWKKGINCIFLVVITYLSVYITIFKVEIQTNGYITLTNSIEDIDCIALYHEIICCYACSKRAQYSSDI